MIGYRRLTHVDRPSNTNSQRLATCVALFGLLFSGGAGLAQSAPSISEQFETRISEFTSALGDSPRLKKLSQQQRRKVAEFVAGNMSFVTLHEMAHAAFDELHLHVIGREEDGADAFAVLRLLEVEKHRELVDAAEGWFLSHRRDQRDGKSLAFYEEHGLHKQRAYQIVCLMVGSDPDQFADLANATKLPHDRRARCKRDYTRASSSWDGLLKPHLRSDGEPKTKIEIAYGDGKGMFDAYARGFRALRLLETMAENAADKLDWPAPLTLEMQSCGFINARWVEATRKLTLCYELADDFAELYRDFNKAPTDKKRKSR